MKKKSLILVSIASFLLLAFAFLLFISTYYRADGIASNALMSDDIVSVSQTDYGWLFDGPSDTSALIFYPGAKVEETAYAPLLHRFAESGIDVCLVKMPLHLAIFGANRAEDVIRQESYPNWYIGGHSLGGAMAANYASSHEDELTGVFLFAAYPTKALDNRLLEITIYGSEDAILNKDNLIKGRSFSPENAEERIIQGGNHAQFGNYGPQKGDGSATISAEDQQMQVVAAAIEFINR